MSFLSKTNELVSTFTYALPLKCMFQWHQNIWYGNKNFPSDRFLKILPWRLAKKNILYWGKWVMWISFFKTLYLSTHFSLKDFRLLCIFHFWGWAYQFKNSSYWAIIPLFCSLFCYLFGWSGLHLKLRNFQDNCSIVNILKYNWPQGFSDVTFVSSFYFSIFVKSKISFLTSPCFRKLVKGELHAKPNLELVSSINFLYDLCL